MPVSLLYDLEGIDLDRVAIGREEIEAINPQRYEFQQLTRVCYFAPEEKVIVGVRDITEDEFWVRGHLPGRPIFPGVLMLESAAQLSTVYTAKVAGVPETYGFGGTDDVRFRKMLTIGDRLVIVARALNVTRRRSRFRTQGICDGRVAFEATIFGVALPSSEPGAI